MSAAEELRDALEVIHETGKVADPMDPRKVVIHIHIHLGSPEDPKPNNFSQNP